MEHGEVGMWAFIVLGVLAIIVGGLLSAYSAKKPSRLASWASAYLVLIVGLAQVGIGVLVQSMTKDPSLFLVMLAFVAYNLGNAGVLVGTIYKDRRKHYRKFVDLGGGLLVVSMVALIFVTNQAPMSWQLVFFYSIIVIILMSMPVGLTLSRRRNSKK